MSKAFGIYTIGKALKGAEEFIRQGELTWHATNNPQGKLVGSLPALRNALPQLPTLKAWARPTAEELNQILAQEKFNIRLQPWQADGNTFGVVAINDVKVSWLVTGQTHESGSTKPFTIKNKPSFRLKLDAGIKFLQARGQQEPVVRIPTATGDLVHILCCPREVVGFELLEMVQDIRPTLREARSYYEGVNIPMVKLQQQVKIDWLLGLYTQVGLDTWQITQALQEIIFGMNQYGARVKEATAIAVTRGLPDYYTVDSSFLIWIERQGLPFPLFTAYITEDDWADPGDLDNL